MEEHECDFPETCPVCQGPKPKQQETHGFPFLAKFDGNQCPDCNLPIYKGDKVCYRFYDATGFDGPRALIHWVCKA